MKVCTTHNKIGSNLDYLNDEEFEILLEHAADCRECDELLRKYEGDLIPMLKLALEAEAILPNKRMSHWYSRLFAPTSVAILDFFRPIRSFLKLVAGFVPRQPVHSLGFFITLIIAIVAVGSWLTNPSESTKLDEAAPSIGRPIDVDLERSVHGHVSVYSRSLDGASTSKPTWTPKFEKPRIATADTSKSTVSVTGFSVQEEDSGNLNPTKGQVEETPTGLIIRRSNANLAFVQVQIATNPDDYKNLTCTIYDLSPNPSPPSELRNPSKGYCAWELPVKGRFELVIRNTVTDQSKKRTIITKGNEIQFIEVDFPDVQQSLDVPPIEVSCLPQSAVPF